MLTGVLGIDSGSMRMSSFLSVLRSLNGLKLSMYLHSLVKMCHRSAAYEAHCAETEAGDPVLSRPGAGVAAAGRKHNRNSSIKDAPGTLQEEAPHQPKNK